MPKTETAPDNGAKTNDIIAGLSLLGIGLYLVLHYALDIGHEVYSLSLSSAISSASAKIYHGQFSLTIQLLDEAANAAEKTLTA